MSLYKITIKPVSSYCSPLQSDTLFGAFCWSYLYKYGESALHDLIVNYKDGKPDIIFSNAFPKGRLPMPIGINECEKGQENSITKKERYQKYIEDKQKNQLSMINLKYFNEIIMGTTGKYSEKTESEAEPESKTELSMAWRNMVSRETDTVENIEGRSNLFEVEQYFSEGEFDVYIYSTFEKNVLEMVLKEMFRSGIGAQRSIGKGAFQIVSKAELFDGFGIPEKPNAFIALSNFIPCADDPTEGYYKAFVKYPKVSYISDEGDSPFKKPLIFLKAGSVFFDEPVKTFYGSCIEKIALQGGKVSDDIVIGAYTIAVPCCIKY